MVTTKTRRSAANNSDRKVDRPFDRDLLRKARAIASKYQVIVRSDAECGEYYGRGLELSGAQGDGRTPDQCVRSTRQAMVALVAFMLERGETPPRPAVEQASRNEQLNIRLTSEEKLLIEERARHQGFRGVSEYVRSLALSGPRD